MNAAIREVSPPESPSPGVPSRPSRVYSPRVDILESEKEFVIAADVPGSDLDSIELSVEEGRLELGLHHLAQGVRGRRAQFFRALRGH